MRTPLLLAALAVALAACDAASPSDPEALVGRWTIAEVTTSSWVVSRIDQPVPNFSGPTDGALTVTGAAERTLGAIASAGRTNARFAGRRSSDGTLPNPSLRLTMGPWSSDVTLDLDIGLSTQPGEIYAAIRPVGTTLFTYADGQFTVPEIELLEQSGTGGTVRVGGTIEVPVLQLRAGVEALTRTSVSTPDFPHALVFRSDGSVLREDTHQTEAGRWEATDTGEGTMTFDDVATRFRFAVEDGGLRLTYDYETEAEVMGGVESSLFAEPSSIASARSQSVHAYRAGR
ncbi:hypothetical protein [Rubrivirga sp. IMCC43871]|uniref:hypothetical protein n=1 Tax=Rubrivirga sp. IMCC43871 TaxID=3391575 RepID=UPI00399039B0